MWSLCRTQSCPQKSLLLCFWSWLIGSENGWVPPPPSSLEGSLVSVPRVGPNRSPEACSLKTQRCPALHSLPSAGAHPRPPSASGSSPPPPPTPGAPRSCPRSRAPRGPRWGSPPSLGRGGGGGGGAGVQPPSPNPVLAAVGFRTAPPRGRTEGARGRPGGRGGGRGRRKTKGMCSFKFKKMFLKASSWGLKGAPRTAAERSQSEMRFEVLMNLIA